MSWCMLRKFFTTKQKFLLCQSSTPLQPPVNWKLLEDLWYLNLYKIFLFFGAPFHAIKKYFGYIKKTLERESEREKIWKKSNFRINISNLTVSNKEKESGGKAILKISQNLPYSQTNVCVWQTMIEEKIKTFYWW